MTDSSLVARVERLREVAEALEECDTEEAVFDRAITEADSVLSFESAIAVVNDDGLFRPYAVTAPRLTPASLLTAEDGIAGRTLREGETQLVSDVEAALVSFPVDPVGAQWIPEFETEKRLLTSLFELSIEQDELDTLTENGQNPLYYDGRLYGTTTRPSCCIQSSDIDKGVHGAVRGLITVDTYSQDMPIMSSDDFSVHDDGCSEVGDGMPISDLPDEVTSIDDLDCPCWEKYDSLEDI